MMPSKNVKIYFIHSFLEGGCGCGVGEGEGGTDHREHIYPHIHTLTHPGDFKLSFAYFRLTVLNDSYLWGGQLPKKWLKILLSFSPNSIASSRAWKRTSYKYGQLFDSTSQ
jgi:hypothetical protein